MKLVEILVLVTGIRERPHYGGDTWSLIGGIWIMIIIAGVALTLLHAVWILLMPYVRITPSSITVFRVARRRRTNTWNAVKEIRRVGNKRIELYFYGGDKIALDLNNLSGRDRVLLKSEIERLSRVPMTDAPPRSKFARC